LIERKNPPFGFALPGGFVEYGEMLEEAIKREVKEETNLELNNLKQFHVYSDPRRDSRVHSVSVVFTAKTYLEPKAGDDAKKVFLLSIKEIKKLIKENKIVFDHGKILNDFLNPN
jgi:8-oxo-dGTP diphosphatase